MTARDNTKVRRWLFPALIAGFTLVVIGGAASYVHRHRHVPLTVAASGAP